ncbi:hypothetical protein HDU81_010684 [Chytriomyces hyalinus]|nr:hypothetical protein HDU81_010684 [Chytriomyces hyalinus]
MFMFMFAQDTDLPQTVSVAVPPFIELNIHRFNLFGVGLGTFLNYWIDPMNSTTAAITAATPNAQLQQPASVQIMIDGLSLTFAGMSIECAARALISTGVSLRSTRKQSVDLPQLFLISCANLVAILRVTVALSASFAAASNCASMQAAAETLYQAFLCCIALFMGVRTWAVCEKKMVILAVGMLCGVHCVAWSAYDLVVTRSAFPAQSQVCAFVSDDWAAAGYHLANIVNDNACMIAAVSYFVKGRKASLKDAQLQQFLRGICALLVHCLMLGVHFGAPDWYRPLVQVAAVYLLLQVVNTDLDYFFVKNQLARPGTSQASTSSLGLREMHK